MTRRRLIAWVWCTAARAVPNTGRREGNKYLAVYAFCILVNAFIAGFIGWGGLANGVVAVAMSALWAHGVILVRRDRRNDDAE